MALDSTLPRVFISYKAGMPDGNTAIAKNLAKVLKNSGNEVWFDQESMVPGSNWNDQILSAIVDSDVLVLLLPQSTNDSAWIKREVDFARGARVPILPIISSNKTDVNDYLRDLGTTQIVKIEEEDDSQNYQFLVETVSQLVKISRTRKSKKDDEFRAKIQQIEREELEKEYKEQYEKEVGRVIFETIRAIEKQKQIEEGIKVKPVFGEASSEDDFKCDIFMIMPFLEEFNSIYKDYVKPTVEDLGFTIKRGDDFFSHHDIMNEVWSAIYASEIVIADCTGRNPNVFYELGIAHTLGKPAILITQNIDDVPFDVRGKRFIVYKDNSAGLKQLRDKLKEYVSKAAKK